MRIVALHTENVSISIVIPLYNKEEFVRNTLLSVLNQTFQNFEIIIVDDGSTDRSIEFAKEFNDSRIRIITQENRGVSASRNTGIKNAKYDYIAFLDADDEWKPYYLQEQVNLIIKYPECSVFACAYERRNNNRELKPLKLNKMPFSSQTGVLTNYFEVASCSHPPLWTSAVTAKKEAILSVGGFLLGVKTGEDLLMWARLAVKYPIAYNKNSLSIYNVSPSKSYENSSSPSPQENDLVGKELEKLYKKNKSLNGLRNYVALWYKMRASMFLLLGDRKKTWRESFRSLKYDPANIRVWAYILLLLFPKSFRYKIFQKLGNQ